MPTRSAAPRPHLLPLSGGSIKELESLARRYADHLKSADQRYSLEDLCLSAIRHEPSQPTEERLAILFHTQDELLDHLEHYLKGERRFELRIGRKDLRLTPKIAFVFCGQGPPWEGVGDELLRHEPAFRSSMEECDNIVRRFTGRSLLTELQDGKSFSRMDSLEIALPALVSLQAALFNLWRSWGVEPQAVIGHSAGDITAAYAGGILDLEDALRIAFQQGRLLEEVAAFGKMVNVGLPVEAVEKAALPLADRISIAGINGPQSVVISGEGRAMDEFIRKLPDDVFLWVLDTKYAFHSPKVEPALKELEASLAKVEPKSAKLPVFSTLTGNRYQAGDYAPSYWARQMRQPVRFEPTLRTMLEDGYNTFLEIGPYPALSMDIIRSFEKSKIRGLTIHSLKAGGQEREIILANLAALYAQGYEVDWHKLYPSGNASNLRLRSAEIAPDPIASWFYEVQWSIRTKEHPKANSYGSSGDGVWLLLADRSGVGSRMKELLEAQGDRCVTVSYGKGFSKMGRGNYEVNPLELDDFKRLLEDVSKERTLFRAMVHLWSLDAPSVRGSTSNGIRTAQEIGVYSALYFVQSLIHWGSRDIPRLWLITSGAQHIEGSPIKTSVEFSQAPLWGFGRAVMHEFPNLRCSLVDLGSKDSSELEGLILEFRADDSENQIALRGKDRYVVRLASRPRLSDSARVQKPLTNTWLVTNGLGELGFSIAHWLVEMGVRHLILTGRAESPASVRGPLGDIRKSGVQVMVSSDLDIRDSGQLAQLMAQVENSFPPIQGVIHVAGAASDADILKLTHQRLQSLMEPKILSAWNLHKSFNSDSLEFFILFSTFSSVLGASGQAGYTASNAFLDGLAHHRRIEGLKAMSVNWGPWAADLDESILHKYFQGLQLIDTKGGLAALRRLLDENKTSQVLVMPFNLRQWRQTHPRVADIPLLSELDTEQRKDADSSESSFRTTLLKAKADDRSRILSSHVQGLVAQLLKQPLSSVDVMAPLDSLGLNSIVGLELRNQLETSLGISLPATLIWGGHRRIIDIVAYLSQKFANSTQSQTADDGASPSSETEKAPDESSDIQKIMGETPLNKILSKKKPS